MRAGRGWGSEGEWTEYEQLNSDWDLLLFLQIPLSPPSNPKLSLLISCFSLITTFLQGHCLPLPNPASTTAQTVTARWSTKAKVIGLCQRRQRRLGNRGRGAQEPEETASVGFNTESTQSLFSKSWQVVSPFVISRKHKLLKQWIWIWIKRRALWSMAGKLPQVHQQVQYGLEAGMQNSKTEDKQKNSRLLRLAKESWDIAGGRRLAGTGRPEGCPLCNSDDTGWTRSFCLIQRLRGNVYRGIYIRLFKPLHSTP